MPNSKSAQILALKNYSLSQNLFSGFPHPKINFSLYFSLLEQRYYIVIIVYHYYYRMTIFALCMPAKTERKHFNHLTKNRLVWVVIRTPKYLQPNNTRLSDFTFGKFKVITELRYAALTLKDFHSQKNLNGHSPITKREKGNYL